MAKVLTSLNSCHKTLLGHIVSGVLELALVIALASWAINSGELWQYLLAVVLLIGSIKNFVKAGMKFFHGKDKTGQA